MSIVAAVIIGILVALVLIFALNCMGGNAKVAGMSDDDTPQMIWTRWHWIALGVGACLWALLWYGASALLYFILSLR